MKIAKYNSLTIILLLSFTGYILLLFHAFLSGYNPKKHGIKEVKYI